MRIRILTFASIAVTGMGMTLVLTPAHAAQRPPHRVVNVSDANARPARYGSFTEAVAKVHAERRATGESTGDSPVAHRPA